METNGQRAVHSLRVFARELLTVVAGIIIAIGLGQIVEGAQQQASVAEAREALRQELRANDQFYEFRVAVNACVARRLSELSDIVEDAAAHRKSELVGDLSPHMGHLLADDVWQSERSAQTLVHFPKHELAQYSLTYSQQVDIRRWVNQEIDVWAAIRLLQGDPNRLAPSDLTLIRQNIQLARALNYLIATNSKTELANAAKLGVQKSEADPQDVRGVCQPLTRAMPTVPYTTY